MAFDFNKLMQKTKETAEKVAGKSKDIAKNVADKTAMSGKVAKLSAEITSEKENLKKAYMELGKYYYEHYEDENPATEELLKAVNTSLELIEAKRVSIEELKAAIKASGDGNADVDVEMKEAEAPAVEVPAEEAPAAAEVPAVPAEETAEAPVEEVTE